MPADRVTLASLRKLAREAFPTASFGYNFDAASETAAYYSEVVSTAGDVRGWGWSKQSARRQLRDLLLRLVRGEEIETLRRIYVPGAEEDRNG